MNRASKTENYLLIGHVLSMAFGLAGIALVLPNIEFQAKLAEFSWGPTIFGWSMAGWRCRLYGVGYCGGWRFMPIALWASGIV